MKKIVVTLLLTILVVFSTQAAVVDTVLTYSPSMKKNIRAVVITPDRYAAGKEFTGLSMGGHGDLYLAFRHPDVNGFAGSMSGGVDIRPFSNNWEFWTVSIQTHSQYMSRFFTSK